MLATRRGFEWTVVLALGTVFGAAGAWAQTTPTQELDRVNAVTPKAVLEMAFEDPASADPFDDPPVITTTKGFSACQLTATKGLLCLDQNNGNPGRWVRKWDPVSAAGETTPYLFSCEDPKLGLDTSKGTESCTGITADDEGGVVIAGKRKGGYNLIKVAHKSALPATGPGACTSTSTVWKPLSLPSGTQYCFKVLLPRDRPLLVDVTYTKLTFPNDVTCTGVLGLETRTELVFFKDPDEVDDSPSCLLEPVVLASGSAWGLIKSPKEVLQGATVVKFQDGGPSFALVVSSLGRVLAKRTDVAGTPFAVKLAHSNGSGSYNDFSALRNSRAEPFAPDVDPNACKTGTQKYGIRTSTKSGSLYVTDQNFCEVTALKPVGSTFSSTQGLMVVPFTGRDLVLATKLFDANTSSYPAADTYPPLEPTLAPGVSIDLSKCADANGCTLVAASDGGPAATLSDVKLASNAKGMTLFKIKNIVDCRWIPTPKPAICNEPGVIVGGSTPETQFLCIAPLLLPQEVTDQFPDGFFDDVPMCLSPNYRAQVSRGRYYFDAFFFVPQPGVIWKDVFSLELDIDALTGDGEHGCKAPNVAGWQSLSKTVSNLLKWDITTTMSEFVQVIGGPVPGTPSYTDMLINTGCGSTRTTSPRGSGFPYNTELTPTIYTHTAAQNANDPPEDFFVHMTVDLFYDLRLSQNTTACQAGGPLASIGTVCAQLTQAWNSARDKLDKCIESMNYPKQSEAVNNCNSFRSQLDSYVAVLTTYVPPCVAGSPCGDPENRSGELRARAATLRHVYDDRMLPSMPTNGFRYPEYEGLPLPQ
jgi:hypothetical protein